MHLSVSDTAKFPDTRYSPDTLVSDTDELKSLIPESLSILADHLPGKLKPDYFKGSFARFG